MANHDPDETHALQARVARLEVELAESRAQIARLRQSWEQWLRLISHDLRGPLTLVLGHTQSALQQAPAGAIGDPERHDLQRAVSAAQRLDKMIGEFVDAARLEAQLLVLTVNDVELTSVIRDQIGKVRRRFPERLVRSSVPKGLPVLRTDARRAGQVVATLLSNAILFSPDASPVVLTVRHGNGRIVVAVEDRGVGLSEDEKQHLFEPFYRPERARDVRREGLGLSLHVAGQIAARLGGCLWAESAGPDRGATFFFSLPQ